MALTPDIMRETIKAVVVVQAIAIARAVIAPVSGMYIYFVAVLSSTRQGFVWESPEWGGPVAKKNVRAARQGPPLHLRHGKSLPVCGTSRAPAVEAEGTFLRIRLGRGLA